MSTSATARDASLLRKLTLLDLLDALFCALFGAVYESFSHGVYAYGMIYAFAFPLALGVLPLMLLELLKVPLPDRPVRSVYHAGIATLTVGSLVSGALEIYGTSSPLTIVYWLVGGALTFVGVLLFAGRLLYPGRQEDA